MKKVRNFGFAAAAASLVWVGCGEKSNSQPEPMPDTLQVEAMEKPVIYQMLTRLFGNKELTNKTYGTMQENGVGKFGDVNEAALKSLKEMGVTHVWYTGVIEHATMTAFPDANIPADDADVVKGRAGSPYAIKDYYDVTPLLAHDPKNRMAEFVKLVERTHASGLKVIVDFVPNHVARNYRSDARPDHVADLGETDKPSVKYSTENNFYYLPDSKFQVPKEYNPLGAEVAPKEDKQFDEVPARVTGNNVFNPAPSVNDWFETIKLNYGVEYTDSGEIKHFDPIPETWTKMRDIMLFWAGKGVDGFRCDIAEMVPVEFWGWVIGELKAKHPALIFIAEIYNPSIYVDYVEKGKFDYLYDKVGVYDAVRPLMAGKGDVARIDSALLHSKGIEDNMLRFLENHDEQRIASPDFAGDAWTGVPGMTVSALLGRGPVMVYFGQEVGEPGFGVEGFQGNDGRTTIFDFWGVPKHQQWMNNGKFDGGQLDENSKSLRAFYTKLLNLCRSHEALRIGDYLAFPSPAPNVYAFARFTGSSKALIVASFEREKTIDVKQSVSAQMLETLGLKTTGSFTLKDQLGDMAEIKITAKDWLESGLSLNLKPKSAHVFTLTAQE